jgi:hypothetical protein
MKKLCVCLAALCVSFSALYAQSPYYAGQGGKNLGGIRVSAITRFGLSESEAPLLPLIRMTLANDFSTYAGMIVPVLEDTDSSTRYTLTGNIRKIADLYYIDFTIKDSAGATKTSYGPIQCTLGELQNLKAIKEASEKLITEMGVTLTQAGKDALRKTATNEAEAMNALAKSVTAGATTFEKAYYTYQAQQLDPASAEAARRLAAYQTENYKVPEINLAVPDIQVPEIKAAEYKAPEIKMAATGNIRVETQERVKLYNDQKEASRLRQESGNKAMKDLQDAFLAQFQAQSRAVKEKQRALLAQRDILLGQQKTLLAKQRQTIAQLRDTENSYDTFFKEHPPFEIIYADKVDQLGNVDGAKGTANWQFRIASIGNQSMQVIPRMFADFEKGLDTITQGLRDINTEFDKIERMLAQLESAGNRALRQLVDDYAAQMRKVQAAENDYAAQLANLEAKLQTTGYAQMGRDYAVKPDTGYAVRLAKEYAVQPSGYAAAKDKTLGDTWSRTKWTKDEKRTFAITARLLNDAGKTIGTADVSLTNLIPAAAYTQPESASAVGVFRDVPANALTDAMTVSIQKVDGRNVAAASNTYIKISPLEADGFTKDGYDINGYDRLGYNKFGYNRSGYDKDGYDKLGYNKDGYNRQGRNSIGLTKQEAQQAAKRFAKYQRNARVKQFAEERLGGEIFAGGGQAGEDRGFGIVGADFIFRLGKPNGGSFFPWSLIAEGAFFGGKDILGGNVGGGLRLAFDLEGFTLLFTFLDISVTGGVSFMKDDAASPVPYLRAGGSLEMFTGGTFIWFYPDSDPGIGWYCCVKFLLGAKLN